MPIGHQASGIKEPKPIEARGVLSVAPSVLTNAPRGWNEKANRQRSRENTKQKILVGKHYIQGAQARVAMNAVQVHALKSCKREEEFSPTEKGGTTPQPSPLSDLTEELGGSVAAN